jgi:hypothetical protein
MKLGLLYKNGEVVNHRSLLKVVINPILRYFGFCIGTNLEDNGYLGSYSLMKCEKRSENISWDMNNHNEYDYILKVRSIF